VICAECGCDVRNGIRVITCQTGGACCCDTIPQAPDAVTSTETPPSEHAGPAHR